MDSFAAALAATELVANALEHTPGDGKVELVLGWEQQGFRIEVYDGEPLDMVLEDLLRERSAAAASVGEPEEDGRGLLIIRAVADRAGIRTTSEGKAVWCLLAPA